MNGDTICTMIDTLFPLETELDVESMGDPLQGIGERVGDLRGKHGWSQKKLAEEASETDYRPSVTQSQIANIESGQGDKLPSTRLLAALADVLHTSSDYLLGLTTNDDPAGDREEQVNKIVHDPQRRAQMQEMCDLLVNMPQEDVDFVSRLTRRLANTRPATSPATRQQRDSFADLVVRSHREGGADFSAEILAQFASMAPMTNEQFILALWRIIEYYSKGRED